MKIATALLLIPVTLFAQEAMPPATSASVENPPTLSAAAILNPAYLSGEGFSVRDAAPSYAGANHFTIDSDFGVFEVNGNQMLVRRISEISAMAKMRSMSRSSEFADAAGRAAANPLVATKELVKDPVGTVAGIPKGAWKFVNRAGQTVKERASGQKRATGEGNGVESMIGFSKTKRDLALKLGVDPYSSNEVFQKELNRVAWPVFAGGFTVKLGMAAVTGGAGVALSAANWTETLNAAIRDMAPTDLREMNRKKLLKMGVGEALVGSFISNTAFSPTTQTLLVATLEQMPGVSGRAAFLQQANASEHEDDAVFFQQSALLMARINAAAPITKITHLNGLPVCILKDKTVLVPIQWDYVAWTPLAANFITALKAEDFGVKASGYTVAVTGVFSPMAAQALRAQGVNFTEKQLPGPLL